MRGPAGRAARTSSLYTSMKARARANIRVKAWDTSVRLPVSVHSPVGAFFSVRTVRSPIFLHEA